MPKARLYSSRLLQSGLQPGLYYSIWLIRVLLFLYTKSRLVGLLVQGYRQGYIYRSYTSSRLIGAILKSWTIYSQSPASSSSEKLQKPIQCQIQRISLKQSSTKLNIGVAIIRIVIQLGKRRVFLEYILRRSLTLYALSSTTKLGQKGELLRNMTQRQVATFLQRQPSVLSTITSAIYSQYSSLSSDSSLSTSQKASQSSVLSTLVIASSRLSDNLYTSIEIFLALGVGLDGSLLSNTAIALSSISSSSL